MLVVGEEDALPNPAVDSLWLLEEEEEAEAETSS